MAPAPSRARSARFHLARRRHHPEGTQLAFRPCHRQKRHALGRGQRQPSRAALRQRFRKSAVRGQRRRRSGPGELQLESDFHAAHAIEHETRRAAWPWTQTARSGSPITEKTAYCVSTMPPASSVALTPTACWARRISSPILAAFASHTPSTGRRGSPSPQMARSGLPILATTACCASTTPQISPMARLATVSSDRAIHKFDNSRRACSINSQVSHQRRCRCERLVVGRRYARNSRPALRLPTAKANGGSADAVLGQTGFTRKPRPLRKRLGRPLRPDCGFAGGVWIGDTSNLRVLHYTPQAGPTSSPAASISISLSGKTRMLTQKPSATINGAASCSDGVARVEYRIGKKGGYKIASGSTS